MIIFRLDGATPKEYVLCVSLKAKRSRKIYFILFIPIFHDSANGCLDLCSKLTFLLKNIIGNCIIVKMYFSNVYYFNLDRQKCNWIMFYAMLQTLDRSGHLFTGSGLALRIKYLCCLGLGCLGSADKSPSLTQTFFDIYNTIRKLEWPNNPHYWERKNGYILFATLCPRGNRNVHRTLSG